MNSEVQARKSEVDGREIGDEDDEERIKKIGWWRE